MLRSLRIENYALIDRLELEFNEALNLLTGETGSGKSIVVEAVGLLLGDKGSAGVIRSGAESARLAGVFSADADTPAQWPTQWKELRARLNDAGIEIAAGEDLILQRELLAAGRSRIFINNQPATVALLRQIAPALAEIHGQNEQQELFLPSAQLELLDRFGALAELCVQVRGRFAEWQERRRAWEDLRRQHQEWLRQMDLWQFQKRELEQAGLNPELDHHLDQRLEEEKRVLAHAERIREQLAAAYDLLYDAAQSAASSISAAERNLAGAAAYDPSLAGLSEALLSAQASVEDVALTVRDRLSHLDASPARLEAVENRLAALDRLKRKYGPTLTEVMQYAQQIAGRVAAAEGGEAELEELERRVKESAAAYQEAASALSAVRHKAARDLKRAVERELAELAMSGTRFEAQLTAYTAEAEWRATGVDRVAFLLAPNAGEPLAPLQKIASGGEVSRVMLALETVIATRKSGKSSPAHTLIFDEVDSGIGGRAAETVGRKLRELGESKQVLCVTHLPQIASFAHHHYRVEKLEQNGRTVTRVELLDARGRRDELARMLSGAQITPALRKHAGQLLRTNTVTDNK